MKASLSQSKAHDSDSSDSEGSSRLRNKQKQIVLKPGQRKLSISQRNEAATPKEQLFALVSVHNNEKTTEPNHPHTFNSQESTSNRIASSTRVGYERMIKNSSVKQIPQDLSSLHTKSFNLNNINMQTSLKRSNNEAMKLFSRNGVAGARQRAVPSLVQSSIPNTREQKKAAIKIEEVLQPRTDSINIDTFVIE